MKRLAVVISAVVLYGAVGVSGASAQTTDAVSVARALIAAEAAHNVSAAVGFFAPGAIVNLPTGTLATPAAILAWQQELAAGNFQPVINTPVAVTPEVVTFSGTVAFDLFRSVGIASLDSTWQLTIQLGKVTTFNFDFTPASAARLGAALAGAGSGSGSGSATPAAAPATASSRTLALTGADLALPGAVSGLAVVVGLVVLGLARRPEEASAQG